MIKSLASDLEGYSTAHSQAETPLLQKIRRETYLQVLMPHMLSGPVQGALLAMLVRMTRARRVLEIGTFTGYASLWMAQALPDPASAAAARDDAEVDGEVDTDGGPSQAPPTVWLRAYDRLGRATEPVRVELILPRASLASSASGRK